MTKIILLDLDGVTIKRKNFFSQRLAVRQKIPHKNILTFFKNEYKQAVRGRADIKKVLPAYFKKWNWQGSLDGLLKYWFDPEKEEDLRVMKILKALRLNGKKVYLVSDNEKHRKNYLLKNLGLHKKFDRCFFSCDLGFAKSEPEFFKKVLKNLEIEAKEIFYWDDDRSNIQSARLVGIAGKVYQYKRFKIWSKRLLTNK